MILEKINENVCFGCGACVIACPAAALRLYIDERGFLKPKLIGECISCNLCEEVCPALNPVFISNKPDCFAGWSRNKFLRSFSSSGGVATSLSLDFVSRGGYVVGASYSNDFRLVKHEVAKNPQDILRFTGSKYVQSNPISALSLLRESNNEKFLIIGTPCMICGVRKLMEKKVLSGDFVLIDLFCHGVPSYLLWWAYLKYLEKRIGRILFINQRFKPHGWRNFATYVVGTKGIYLKTHKEDPFMMMFLGNYFLRESCFKCPFRLTRSCADIRLGDFWNPFFHSDLLGLSLVLVYTDKAIDLLESSKDVFLRAIPFEAIYASQPSRVIKPLNYEDTFKTLMERRDLEEVLRTHFKFIALKNKIATMQSHIRNLVLKLARNILFSKQV